MYVPNPQMRFGISATPPRKNWAKSTAAQACYIKLDTIIAFLARLKNLDIVLFRSYLFAH